MAAVIQSYPHSSTVTMLQTRPNSASGLIQNTQQGHHYSLSNPQMHRNSFHGINGNVTTSTYRGHTSVAPAGQYAFHTGLDARPNMGFLQQNQRTASAPTTPTLQTVDRSRYPAAASVSTTSSSSSSEVSAAIRAAGIRDDLSISTAPASRWGAVPARPQSTILSSAVTPPVKSIPDRYRRSGNKRADSNGANSPSGTVQPAATWAQVAQAAHQPVFQIPTPQFVDNRARSSFDENRLKPGKEEMARYRRRSIHTSDMGGFVVSKDSFQQGYQQGLAAGISGSRPDQQHPLRSYPTGGQARPASSPGRTGSTEDTRSALRASQPSVNASTTNPAQLKPTSEQTPDHDKSRSQSRIVDIPTRVSSTPDAAKRPSNPSPLSKPVTMSPETPVTKDSFASAVSAAIQSPPRATPATRPDSPAAKQLAAHIKEDKKSKTSRLRRAFSFGSAAELRKASGPPPAEDADSSATDRTRLRKDRYQDEREAEQAKIAERQEAGGIGAGIYSGQGNFFSGSTDNLSISSTASSASIMLRKMGKGVKKSTRSLVGLFRPKSVIGVPAADAPLPEFSQAQVSMVTVEAERERVNVNANPHDQVGGGTGFPKLERNSIDAAAQSHRGSESINESPRRSVVGGEKERAEVLAAVKKGILKRNGTDSPTGSPMIRPVDNKPNFNLPSIPIANDSPHSSAPSTPNDDSQGHKRTGSVALNGEDYFMSALRFRGESKSQPGSPNIGPGALKRNATFSPRIQFHDTWPSGEYDRRGEIATCNRLTPMLAQQIKEELNTFKMEMEVHENSKIYTHFF